MKIYSSLFPILLVTILLNGCSTNKLLSSWNDESLQNYSLETVLIIGVAKNDETKRRIYEDTFVDSLNQTQTKSFASYTLSKESIEPTKEALREVVQKARVKTVLITHLVTNNENEFFLPSSYVLGSNSYSRDGLYNYYSLIYNSVSASGSYTSTSKVILEANIYDVSTEKLIWSGRTASIDPVMTRKYYQQLIDLFLNDLTSKNLL